MGGEYLFALTENISDINVEVYRQKLIELSDKYQQSELIQASHDRLQRQSQPNWMSEKDYQKYFNPNPIEETWNSDLYQKLKNGDQKIF